MIRPSEDDVLCGKNKDCVNFPGSVRFRDIVDAYAHRYAAASSKFEKMVITKTIYDQVIKTSRFLKYNEKEELWEEISMMAARDKIGHSLRFAARAKRRFRKQIKKSDSTTSLSSAESEGESGEKVMQSLLEQMKQGVFGSESSAPMPETSTSVPIPTHVVSRSSSYENEPVETFDAEELLILFDDEDRSTKDRFDNFADDMRHMIQKIERGTSNHDSFDSLLSEPVGEWDDDQ